MKNKILTNVILASCFIVALAVFADLSGKWSGTVTTAGGTNFPLTYQFKVDGGALTGTVTSPQGELAITDGKTDGTAFTFNVDVNGSIIKNVGRYYAAGDTVSMDIDFGGAKTHTRLVRPQ